MDKEENQQKEELRKKKAAFAEIRDKFNKWRFNMYLCTGLYVLIFVIAQSVNEHLIKPKAADWLKNGETLVILIAAIILGICFIADSIITSYLKTPLQRLAIKIEGSPLEEKKKSSLMRATQETNELFKETLKKFGILVIPVLIASVIDTKGETKVLALENDNEIGRIVEIGGKKNSESTLYYICYLIPILYATWRIWQVNRELNKIEKKVIDEQRKQASN